MKTSAMWRPCLGTLVLLFGLGACASAQFIAVGPGSTFQGDYLRGVGIAAIGEGMYNLNTAQANAINTQTFMSWNEYFSSVIERNAQIRAETRRAMLKQANENYKKIQDRYRENPEEHDVMTGDALNAVLQQLLDPSIQDSSFRAAEVPLSVDLIRRIPFKLGEKNEKFSMERLSPKGKGKWPVGLQDDRFDLERRGYERALDKALEQALEAKMQIPTVDAIETAVDNLLYKLDHVLGKSTDRRYTEAMLRLNQLRDTARLLKTHRIELAIADIDKYSGTTVNDLRLFMQKHNLRFAPAETPSERKLYPELHAALRTQRDSITIPAKAPDK